MWFYVADADPLTNPWISPDPDSVDHSSAASSLWIWFCARGQTQSFGRRVQ